MIQKRWSRTGMLARRNQTLEPNPPENRPVDGLGLGGGVGSVVSVSVDIGELNPLVTDGLGDRFGA